NILPLYAKHESTFDYNGIHGRMHICRALLFAEVMGRLYISKGVNLDIRAIRLAAAFHDSGRQGNGVDLWEKDSGIICRTYIEKNTDEKYGKFVGDLIYKAERVDGEIHWAIFHDADVLEIMRPCCGHGGLYGFKQNFLRFLGERDSYTSLFENPYSLRQQLIVEAWEWIKISESKKPQFENSRRYLGDLLACFDQNFEKFPFLNEALKLK
ncbi:MAG: hypothetical protein NT121_23135, partial [Chloroflexi bacterium]|nr:hypothetical protein [Chloroflexota bacterium]